MPDRGLPGSCHVFSTDLFKPGELITTWLNTPSDVQPLGLSGSADAIGAISFTLCTGGLAFGDYSLVAYGNESLIAGLGAFRVQSTSGYTAPPPIVRPAPPPRSPERSLHARGGITGRVTDASAQPLAGVLVLVSTLAGQLVTSEITAADGSYAIYYGLASGQYRVEFRPALVLSRTTARLATAFATPDPVTVTDPNITPDVNGVLTPGGSIGGRVTAAEGGAAFAGVPVIVRDGVGATVATAVSAADGSYSVRGLAGGTYQLLFEPSAARNCTAQAYADRAAPTIVSLTAPTSIPGIDVALERRALAAQVLGTVTAADTGLPLAGVPVIVRDGPGVVVAVAQTDAAGAYSTGALPAGVYQETARWAVSSAFPPGRRFCVVSHPNSGMIVAAAACLEE